MRILAFQIPWGLIDHQKIMATAWPISLKRLGLAIFVMILSSILCQPAPADSLLDGFEEENPTESENARDALPHGRVPEQRLFCLTGHMKTSGAYNFSNNAPVREDTNWQGFSSLRAEMLLELEIKPTDKWLIFDWVIFASGLAWYDFIYLSKGRENYTDEVLDTYETKVQLRELYLLATPAKHLDIKTGRQIVVWGTSDYVRVVDILNPLDLKDPGTTDIEDLRLPVAMSKIDYYRESFNLSGIIIHEVRFNETPPYGSGFYPYSSAPAYEETPDCDLKNTQFALALKARFSGWDMGLYGADIYHPDTYIEDMSDSVTTALVQKHERVNMFGASTTIVNGSWIFKAESAYWDNLRYTNIPNEKFSRLDVMAGFEYSGFDDTRICVELVNQHLFNYKSQLKNDPDDIDEDQLQSVICIEKKIMHDILTLTVFATGYGKKWQGGSYQRFSAQYDVSDNIALKAGVVFYQSGDLPMFKDIGGNDQLFLELNYSF